MRDHLSVLQNLLQRPRAQDIAQGGGGEQTRRVLRILHIRDRHDRIEYAKVDHRVHGDRDRVFGQDFLRCHVECDCAQINGDYAVNAGQNEKQAWAFGAAEQAAAEAKSDGALVLFDDLDTAADRQGKGAQD